MKLIEVVILVGSQCLSPVDVSVGMTEAAKVQCAVLIRQDPDTEAVEIVPRTAATDPEVIAMLLRPEAQTADDGGTETAEGLPRAEKRPLALGGEEARSDPIETGSLSGRKMQARNPATAVERNTKRTAVRRTDRCGSYKAVWYTNKYGRRKYRCVRMG